MRRSDKIHAKGKNRTVIKALRLLLPLLLIAAPVICMCSVNDPAPKTVGHVQRGDTVSAVNYFEGNKAEPPSDISARSAILIDAQSGSILYEHNADERLPMASTTKIMTALVAAELSPLDKTVSVSAEAVGIEGSSVYLYEGEILSVESLLYALLLESANDAAVAIAVDIGGSVEGFAELMNRRAEELGLRDTQFVNPHGLDSDGHYTTAKDLAKIAKEALSLPVLSQIVSTARKNLCMTEGDGARLLINHNKLLRIYDGAIGVKTGYTKKSGRCLVSAAERNGVRLIAVTLNAPNDWKDHMAMLDYGFDRYEYVTLCEKAGFSEPIPVEGGAEQYVTVTNRYDVGVTLPKDRGEIEYTVELPRFEFAPIEKGERLGRLVFRCDGHVIATAELCAAYDVCAVRPKGSIFDGLRKTFEK